MGKTDPFEPRYLQGGLALAKWTLRPASYEGVSSAFEAVFCLAAPVVKKEYERFAADPVGTRLLKERPDLLSKMTDADWLRSLPEGSFGREYQAFMDRMNVDDAKAFAKLANVGEICERMGWEDGVAWFIERMSHTHDLFHTLSGYGSDIAGEGAVIFFTYGQFRLPVLWPILGTLAALRPKIGWRRWHRYLLQAYERGRDCKPLTCADYERLFPMPMEEVRRELGITSIEEAHPREGLVVDYMFAPPEKGLV